MSSNGAPPEPAASGLLLPALVISYPLLSHLSVVLDSRWVQWAALVLLCAIPQYPALRAGRARNWALLALLSVLLLALAGAGGGVYAMMIPPVLLPASIAALFFGTLRRGQVPLVTRMAEAERGTLPPELLAYTRAVTAVWAGSCSLLAAAAVLLAAFAPLPVWSLFTNVLAYALLALLFVGEYAWRRVRFRHLPHAGFAAFVRSLLRADYRTI